DVLLYTSRAVATAPGTAGSLAIARTVSAALSGVVRDVLAARRPAWVLAKGGITSHDIATRGLGIRRAVVAGQLFPGLISVFHPADADPAAIGLPYVVFAGNVGDEGTLAQVVDILNGRRQPSEQEDA
ncbi:MAG TPA: nucleotide-binding domain containing protein, partial [Streptosporangiaceae bacterium]